MSLPAGESAQTAFATSAAFEQLQRIHSLTGLDPEADAAQPDLQEMELERVAEAQMALEAIIMMERQQRDVALRLLAIDEDITHVTQLLQRRTQPVDQINYLGWIACRDQMQPAPLLLTAPPDVQPHTHTTTFRNS